MFNNSCCLVAGCHSFCLFSIFYNIHTFIQSQSYNTVAISSSLVSSVGKTSLRRRAENRTQACLTAVRRATNWATPHHASRRTIYSYDMIIRKHFVLLSPWTEEIVCALDFRWARWSATTSRCACSMPGASRMGSRSSRPASLQIQTISRYNNIPIFVACSK